MEKIAVKLPVTAKYVIAYSIKRVKNGLFRTEKLRRAAFVNLFVSFLMALFPIFSFSGCVAKPSH